MKPLPRLLLVFVILFPALTKAQPLAKTLLWRISGKGLAAPSYLYGTMHLTDERVFRLGDSVYQAIGQSDGFAAELDPRQITLFVVGQIREQILSNDKLSQVLGKKDFDKYGDRLAERLHKNKNDITARDIVNEKNKWIHDKFQTGKMETFLDAYLMDVARREGKWLGGVEMMEDQAGLLHDAVSKSDILELLAERPAAKKTKANDEMEKMISIYSNQDLDGIAAMTENGDSTEMDALLVKRNRKMVANMDSLSHIRTTMFAVGAAHLPGDKGLIRLLRQRGFAVEPVFSSHAVEPAQARIIEKPEPWTLVSDKDSSYSASMPGQAEDLDLFGFQMMKVDIDIFKNTAFFTSSFINPGDDDKMDSTAASMADRIFSKPGKRTMSDVVINGIAGKKYSIKDNDGLKQGYLLRKGKRFYLAFALCTHPDSGNVKDLARFLQSYQVRDPATADQAAESYVFTDSARGYGMNLPAEPKLLKELVAAKKADGISSEVYMTADSKTGLYYLLGCNTLDRGRYIENDSVFLSLITEKIKEQFAGTYLDTSYTMGSFRIAELDGNMVKSPAYHLHSRFYLINNRWYVQSIMYTGKSPDSALQRLFRSFRYIAAPRSVWVKRFAPDSVFSTWTPSDIIRIAERTGNNRAESYNAADTGLATSYEIAASPLPDYYWASSDSAMWESVIARSVGTDSLYSRKKIRNGDTEGIEFIKAGKGSSVQSRYRMFLYGKEIFFLISVQRPAGLTSENSNRFFDSFRFTSPVNKEEISIHHAGALMTAMQSKDSATAVMAMNFLLGTSLAAGDMDTVQKTMLYGKPGYYEPAVLSRYLAEKMGDTGDSGSYAFAVSTYPVLPDSLAARRVDLLRIMARKKDSVSYDHMFRLLGSFPPPDPLPESLAETMSDSLALLSTSAGRLLPLIKMRTLEAPVLDMLNKLIADTLLAENALAPYESEIISGSRDTAQSKFSEEATYVTALGHLNSEAADHELRSYLKDPPKWSGYQAISSLVERGKSVSAPAIEKYAADIYYRAMLFDKMKQKNKLPLFPLKYRSEKALALSRAWAEMDEDYGDTLALVTVISRTINKIPSHIYVVRAWYTGEGGGYLAGYGPYADNPKRGSEKKGMRLMTCEEEYRPALKTSQIGKIADRFAAGED